MAEQERWTTQGRARPKRSPVEKYSSTLFFYPEPRDGVARTKDCPRGFVHGCPAKGTEARDNRLDVYLAYSVYHDRGICWEQFQREPGHVVAAVMTVRDARARRDRRELKKNESKINEMKSSQDQQPRAPQRRPIPRKPKGK